MAEEYALNALKAWAAGEASTRCVSQEEMAGVILQALLAPLLQAIQALRRDTESSFIASSLCELAYQTLLRSSTAHHFFGVAVEPSRPCFSSLCLSTPVSVLCSYHCRSLGIQPPFSNTLLSRGSHNHKAKGSHKYKAKHTPLYQQTHHAIAFLPE